MTSWSHGVLSIYMLNEGQYCNSSVHAGRMSNAHSLCGQLQGQFDPIPQAHNGGVLFGVTNSLAR